MDKYICIHGHFYQPPRENPWLEDVEVQDSAHPFHNWNERITFECYAPNTSSRLLDQEGRIIDIVDNYRLISFNFGPTLLSWMERRTPDIHRKIVEADRLSARDRSGHGNAIAQVYNHLIMPLASRRDKVTQVRWGIADFERRFGRKPEGMWLAETAVDTESLEILADHGIKFTILSPNQAAAARPSGGKDWVDMRGGKIDPSRAYRWTSPGGKTIALFFYDAPISRAVAFEGILNNGETFATRLMDGFSLGRTHPQMVNPATDGESYGHHHRFGDMALAYALRKIQREGSARLTNYGEFLEKHPPEWEVEIIENSAWSCAHGIERWNSDCGCRIGGQPGWNQSWRNPLRKALNDLRDGLDSLFEKKASAFFKDIWSARDAYISLILDRSSKNVAAYFAKNQSRELNDRERTLALKLLEMQRQRMLMFTSCAWFFDELSGIETVAVMQFAARALQLAQDYGESIALEQAFLSALSKAPSNIPSLGNGEAVYRRHVTPVVTDLSRIAAHQAIENIFSDPPTEEEHSLYAFRVCHIERERLSSDGNTLAAGRIKVTSTVTWESMETSYAALHLGGHDIHCVLKHFPDLKGHATTKSALQDKFTTGTLPEVMGLLYRLYDGQVYTLYDLLLEERRRLLSMLITDIVGRYDPIYRALVEDNRKLINMILSVGMPVPETFRLSLEYVLRSDLENFLEKFSAQPKDLAPLARLREDSGRFKISLDWDKASRVLRHHLENKMEWMGRHYSRQGAEEIISLLKVAESLELPMNLWRMENMFYDMRSSLRKTLPTEEIEVFSALGEKLRFRPLEGAIPSGTR